jgi:flagellar hook-basal body complex protein FliE
MSVAIDPAMIGQIAGIKPVEPAQQPAGAADIGAAFAKALSDARGLETDATKAAEKFAKGDTSIGIHEVVIAAEKANIAVRYATTLKNKAVEAYRELMNTQV